jgi:hypothetical protein
MKTMT